MLKFGGLQVAHGRNRKQFIRHFWLKYSVGTYKSPGKSKKYISKRNTLEHPPPLFSRLSPCNTGTTEAGSITISLTLSKNMSNALDVSNTSYNYMYSSLSINTTNILQQQCLNYRYKVRCGRKSGPLNLQCYYTSIS